MYDKQLCKGCRTYIPTSGVCALGITDDNCPCTICLVKTMCKVICDDQDEFMIKEQARILRDKIDEDIIREIIESTRRDNGQQ